MVDQFPTKESLAIKEILNNIESIERAGFGKLKEDAIAEALREGIKRVRIPEEDYEKKEKEEREKRKKASSRAWGIH